MMLSASTLSNNKLYLILREQTRELCFQLRCGYPIRDYSFSSVRKRPVHQVIYTPKIRLHPAVLFNHQFHHVINRIICITSVTLRQVVGNAKQSDRV